MCAYPQLQLVITTFLVTTFPAVSIFRFGKINIVRLYYLNELIGNQLKKRKHVGILDMWYKQSYEV